MSEEKDALPSDAEDGGLKPKPSAQDRKPPPPQQDDDKKTEEDPSEQPS